MRKIRKDLYFVLYFSRLYFSGLDINLSGKARSSVLTSWSFSPSMRHQRITVGRHKQKKKELCVNAHYLNPRLILKYGRNTVMTLPSIISKLGEKRSNFPLCPSINEEVTSRNESKQTEKGKERYFMC